MLRRSNAPHDTSASPESHDFNVEHYPRVLAAAFLVCSHSFPARAQFDTTAWRFAGDTTYQSRDQRFLGTVGLFETLYLPPRKGVNTLVVAVT
jgi:hypothetical protein